jgi:hypothetical protein
VIRQSLSTMSLALAVVLAGCATAAPISLGNDTYMISQTSAGGLFKAMGSLKADVIKRANAFAMSKGKVAIPIAAKESPAYPGHMPNFEYQFRLVEKDDPSASGNALVPRADVVVEMHSSSSVPRNSDNTKSKDVYTELLKLDDLRKRGVLTEAEFEAQKAKLLSEH